MQLHEALPFYLSHILRDLLKLMTINFKKGILSEDDDSLAIRMIKVTIF